MDVRLECKASGRDCSLIVDEHDTATTLMRGALDAWGYTSREYVLLLEGNALDGNDYVRDHAIVSGTTLVVESCDEEYVRAHLEGRLLQDCPKWMLADERIVIGAVRRQGPLLQYASEALKDSFAVVMAAVEHTGAALRFASTRLCGDAVVCKTAVSQNGFALKYVTENMTRDRSVVLAAVEQEGTSLALAHSSLKGDRDVVATAVHNAPEAWRYATEELRAETGNDGHVMYGPYLSNGEEAGQAGLDVCNGAVGLADCDDSYAYFATKTFPYLAGCFGSGNRPRDCFGQCRLLLRGCTN